MGVLAIVLSLDEIVRNGRVDGVHDGGVGAPVALRGSGDGGHDRASVLATERGVDGECVSLDLGMEHFCGLPTLEALVGEAV